MTAVVTARSLAERGLAEGTEVEVDALFKATSVALARTLEAVPDYFHAQPGLS